MNIHLVLLSIVALAAVNVRFCASSFDEYKGVVVIHIDDELEMIPGNGITVSSPSPDSELIPHTSPTQTQTQDQVQVPAFDSSSIILTHLSLFWFFFLPEMTVNSFQMTKYFSKIFIGTRFETTFLSIFLSAFKMGVFVANTWQSVLPARYQIKPHARCIMLASIGSFCAQLVLTLMPWIVKSSNFSANNFMAVLIPLIFSTGLCSGLVESSNSAYVAALPNTYGIAAMSGYITTAAGSASAFVISSASDPFPNYNPRNSSNPTIDAMSNTTSAASQDLVVPEDSIISQYQYIMGSTAVIGFIAIILAQYCHKSPIIIYYENHSTPAHLKYAIASKRHKSALRQISDQYPAKWYPWSMFFTNLFYIMVIASVVPNVVSSNIKSNPDSVFYNVMFVPIAFLVYDVCYTIGMLAPRLYVPNWIMASPVPTLLSPFAVIVLAPIMLLCNFKEDNGVAVGQDPFPNAPRLIKSDIAYLILLGLFCLVSGYNKGLVWATSSTHVKGGEIQTKLGLAISWFNQLGQVLGSILAIGALAVLCKCFPFSH
jgi:hypothetical protein